MHFREGVRIVSGAAEYIDDLPTPPGTLYMAIYRSPYPHARITRVDLSDVYRHGGLAFGPEELGRVIRNPFPLALDIPIKYYPFAKGKARFVGEPIAVILARDPYRAADLLDYVQVDFEPLKPIVTIKDAFNSDTLIHEEIGSNVVMRRRMTFGDPEPPWDVKVSLRFRFHRHSVMPLETYGVVANYSGDELSIWANAQGPLLMLYFISRALGLPQSRIRLMTPRDIGGSFGSKYALYPYITLAAAASILSGSPVKWIESRTEHFIASNSGAERIGEVEVLATREGLIRGLRFRFTEDVGAYPRPPEPGALFRIHGNMNGAYDVRFIEVEDTVILTNKAPTGLNRGYGAPQFYFMLERAVDELARELGMDPLDLRLKNLIREFPTRIGDEYFYETPTGGLYPKQDFEAVVKAIETEYRHWLRQRSRPRLGVGVAVLIEPSGTNLGYVDLALEPNRRRNPHSGAGEYVTITLDPGGFINVSVNSTNEGLGHETTLAEVVASELGIDPSMVRVNYRVDTGGVWGIASGSYSSRFAPVVLSAAIMAARALREKLTRLAMHILGTDSVGYSEGYFYDRKGGGKIDIRRLASAIQWDPGSLPEGLDANLSVTVYYQPEVAKAPRGDRINSSITYSIQAHLAVVEINDFGEVRVIKYLVSHNAGRIFRREFVDSIMLGSIIQGIGMTLYEELKYSDDGEPLTTTFDTYESPTLSETMDTNIELIHFEEPPRHLPSGAHGIGEGPIMGVPAALGNAISNALGKPINELPIKLRGLI